MTRPLTTETTSPSSAPLESAIALLRAARRIVVFSGAGLSRASGIPTYRDTDGLLTIVYPAAELPELAMAHGSRLVTLDMEPLPHLDGAAAVVLRGASEDLLPRLLAGLG